MKIVRIQLWSGKRTLTIQCDCSNMFTMQDTRRAGYCTECKAKEDVKDMKMEAFKDGKLS